MKLSKMSDQLNIDWFTLKDLQENVNAPIAKHASVNSTPSEDVSEVVIAEECDKIEKLANQEYYINIDWDSSIKSHLKEYATACGVSKIIEAKMEVKEVEESKTIVAAKKENLIKTASSVLNIGDAFRLDEKIKAAERKYEDWQEVKNAKSLKDRPSIGAGIVPIRGGENTHIHNEPRFAINQNSLANPNQIEELINSTELDTGARLAQEKAQREETKIANKKEWEQGKINAMPKLDIVSKGAVFPTETLNANPGTNSALSKRIANNFDPATVEDKTAGEMLKSTREERRAGIQREDRSDKSWEQIGEIKSARSISDSFTDSLKKALSKR